MILNIKLNNLDKAKRWEKDMEEQISASARAAVISDFSNNTKYQIK